MIPSSRLAPLLLAGCVAAAVAAAARPALAREAVALSAALGPEIDAAERETYGLFPDLEGFRAARIVREDDGRHVLEYEADEGGRTHRGTRPVSADALELTIRHVAHVETYLRLRAAGEETPEIEARILHRIALRYALDRRWDLAIPVLEELDASYPGPSRALDAPALLADARRLAESRRVLFRRGSLIDRSGRTDLLVFAGYYGVWLGFATPTAAGADTPEEAALGLLTIPPASLVLAHVATRRRGFTDADAALVSLGGNLGTWQGLGWAGVADAESEDVLRAGVLGGLGGIAGAAALVRGTELSEAHVALMGAGMSWGAWLGFLGARFANLEDDDVLASALAGSGALVAGAGFAGRDTKLTKRRVRLMNLGGVVGGILGSGIVLLAGIDDDQAIAGMLGGGSVGGALVALASSADR